MAGHTEMPTAFCFDARCQNYGAGVVTKNDAAFSVGDTENSEKVIVAAIKIVLSGA